MCDMSERDLPPSQHYNYLVNILEGSIDHSPNPITEPTIDPSASSWTISTLSRERSSTAHAQLAHPQLNLLK